MDGVTVRTAHIEVEGTTVDGWRAEYDGTDAVGHSREGALRNLIKAVAQEAL